MTGTVHRRRTLGGWFRLVFGTVAACAVTAVGAVGILLWGQVRDEVGRWLRAEAPGRARMLAYDVWQLGQGSSFTPNPQHLATLAGMAAAWRLAGSDSIESRDSLVALIRTVSLTRPPGAVPLLARFLVSETDAGVRVEAAMALARIGSPAALAAIRMASVPGRTLSTWWHPPSPDADVLAALAKIRDPRVPFNENPDSPVFDEWWKKYEFRDSCRLEDSEGREWVVFPRSTLGAFDDLWLSHRDPGGEWSPGEFIGQIAPKPDRPCDTPDLPRVCALRNGQLFIGDVLGWFDSVELRSVRLDRDGDGLTDLVEARILTDPERVDSDGDGLSDPLDPAPNARTHEWSENDAITQALLQQTWIGTEFPPYRPTLLFVVSRTAPEWRRNGSATISVTSGEETPFRLAKIERVVSYWLPEIDPGYWLSRIDRVLPRSLLGQAERTYVVFISDTMTNVAVRKMGGEWYVVDFGA